MAAEQAFKHRIRLLYRKADKLAADLEKVEAEIKAEQDKAHAAGWPVPERPSRRR
jgi:hypothetical protein